MFSIMSVCQEWVPHATTTHDTLYHMGTPIYVAHTPIGRRAVGLITEMLFPSEQKHEKRVHDKFPAYYFPGGIIH